MTHAKPSCDDPDCPGCGPIAARLTPLGDQVILRNRTVGADHEVCEGTIVAFGPRVLAAHLSGRCAYRKYSGHELVLDGERLLVISESDILCLIKPAATGIES